MLLDDLDMDNDEISPSILSRLNILGIVMMMTSVVFFIFLLAILVESFRARSNMNEFILFSMFFIIWNILFFINSSNLSQYSKKNNYDKTQLLKALKYKSYLWIVFTGLAGGGIYYIL